MKSLCRYANLQKFLFFAYVLGFLGIVFRKIVCPDTTIHSALRGFFSIVLVNYVPMQFAKH